MKKWGKAAWLLFLLSVLLLTASCGFEDRNYLFYQEEELTVNGRYSKNGTEYGVEIEKAADGSGTVRYRSPETLAGMLFRCDESGITMVFGDLSLSLGAIEHDASILLSLFSLEEDCLQELTAENGEIVLNFGDVTVTLDSESELPLAFDSVRGGREIRLVVDSMEK